jgi:hypothetical protein
MPTLIFSYDTGTVPQVSVQLGTASGSKRAVGEIDSGSVRSLCPLLYLKELGLSTADLVKNERKGSPAVGPEFDTWSPRVGVNCQIMIPSLHENDLVPWDKLFQMDLVFADTETLLLGQSDFFTTFDVQFLNGAEHDEGSELKLSRCSRDQHHKLG